MWIKKGVLKSQGFQRSGFQDHQVKLKISRILDLKTKSTTIFLIKKRDFHDHKKLFSLDQNVD